MSSPSHCRALPNPLTTCLILVEFVESLPLVGYLANRLNEAIVCKDEDGAKARNKADQASTEKDKTAQYKRELHSIRSMTGIQGEDIIWTRDVCAARERHAGVLVCWSERSRAVSISSAMLGGRR
jgi:hypothetical protein